MTRRFYVRTYGCQMNEHDSERISGLLAAQGMEPAPDAESADVVVLNTCCIRENADNKLYGHLGHLKSLKARRPGLQIAVGGCLAQKDREMIVERAGHVDVVFGTHNLHRAGALLDSALDAPAPLVEIVDEHRPDAASLDAELPAARASEHAAWVTIQIGCDNSCTFCIVPIVRGPEVSRRMGDVVREVEELAARGVREVTLLGQNVNSYGRDLGAGQWSPQFADLLRAVDAVEGISRIRFTSPHPKDLRDDTIAAMAECTAVCEQLHLPLQAGSDRTLARMHRGYTLGRYLTRLEAARAAIPDLAVTTDLIVGFPGETDDDFQRTLDAVDAAGFDAAYTFVFSPRPGTPAAGMTADAVSADTVAERMARLTEVVEHHALERNQARLGRVEEVLVEGVSKRDAARRSGRTRQGKLVHFEADETTVPPGTLVDVTITHAAPHWLAGEREASGAASRTRIPVTAASTTTHLALVGPTASGKSTLALELAAALGDVEIVAVDSMQVYRELDIGTAKPTDEDRARVRHHMLDVVDPSEEYSVARFQTEARAAITGIEGRRHRALLVGGTGLYVQAVVDDLRFPAEDLALRAELEAWTAAPGGAAAAYAELERSDPVAAARIDPHNARRIVRALEVIRTTGEAFSSFGPGVAGYGPTAFPVSMAGIWLPRDVLARRIDARVRAMRAAGLADEVDRVGPCLSRTASQAIGYKELLAEPTGGGDVYDTIARRTRSFARRQRMWFRRDPRIVWSGTADNPCALLPALLARWRS